MVCQARFSIEASKVACWDRTRCRLGKSLRKRAVIYNSNSACESPFQAPSTNLNTLGYFPISHNEITASAVKTTSNRGFVDIIVDPNQNIKNLLNDFSKLIIVDVEHQCVETSWKIRGREMISGTDLRLYVAMINNEFTFSDIFPSTN